MALGATRDPDSARLTGEIHGSELSALGFNMNFGPVVDINNNQNNPVIGVRAYSDRKELTEILSAAYIRGIHQYGLITALKHFLDTAMSLQIHMSPFRLSHQMKKPGGKQNYRHLFMRCNMVQMRL